MPSQLSRRSRSAFPALVAALLLGALAFRAIEYWQSISYFAADATDAVRSVDADLAVSPVPPDHARIAGLHLFGVAASKEEGARARSELVPETRLPLTLHGVLLEPQDSAAIIGQGGIQHYVRLGDEIPGGGVLQEVAADRVVFERDGRREALRLPRAQSGATPPAAAAPDG